MDVFKRGIEMLIMIDELNNIGEIDKEVLEKLKIENKSVNYIGGDDEIDSKELKLWVFGDVKVLEVEDWK